MADEDHDWIRARAHIFLHHSCINFLNMQGSSRRNHNIMYLCVTKTTGGTSCAPTFFYFFCVLSKTTQHRAHLLHNSCKNLFNMQESKTRSHNFLYLCVTKTTGHKLCSLYLSLLLSFKKTQHRAHLLHHSCVNTLNILISSPLVYNRLWHFIAVASVTF
jgi:hypothetical protein